MLLRALPGEVVRAHVAPHLSDADVANCAAAFRAGNPLRAECAERAARFRGLQDELRVLSTELARVLRLAPHDRLERELTELTRHGYEVWRLQRPYTMFALYYVRTPHFEADVCVWTQHADANVTVTHTATGRRAHFHSWRKRYACSDARKDLMLPPSLRLTAERAFGLRRSPRLV